MLILKYAINGFHFLSMHHLHRTPPDMNLHYILSDSLPVTKGVPQGPIPDPTLFAICINDIALYTHESSVHLYADDTVL